MAIHDKVKTIMRFPVFLLALILCFSAPAFACEGYKNAMSALEYAIEKSASSATPSSPKTPPIAAINHEIGKLEKAIAAHSQSKSKVKAKNATGAYNGLKKMN